MLHNVVAQALAQPNSDQKTNPTSQQEMLTLISFNEKNYTDIQIVIKIPDQ